MDDCLPKSNSPLELISNKLPKKGLLSFSTVTESPTLRYSLKLVSLPVIAAELVGD